MKEGTAKKGKGGSRKGIRESKKLKGIVEGVTGARNLFDLEETGKKILQQGKKKKSFSRGKREKKNSKGGKKYWGRRGKATERRGTTEGGKARERQRESSRLFGRG